MVDIPTLDIEDYDPDLNEEQETVEDKSGGALTYAIVGAGQGGGRMAKAFYDMGKSFLLTSMANRVLVRTRLKLRLQLSEKNKKFLTSSVRSSAVTLTASLYVSAYLVDLAAEQ